MLDSTVSAADFAFVAQLVRAQCGLVIEPGKEYLVRGRLTPIAQRLGLSSIHELVDRLRSSTTPGLATQVVEAMVTTETSFFRDLHPFEAIRKVVLPELIARRQATRQLRIWFAASSSGQEPYSMALLLREYFPELDQWQIQLQATDFSQEMLERSRAGRYSQIEVNRGLPTHLLLKWFRQEGVSWELDDRIRSLVSFTPLNLAHPWPAMPPWDLVFMRNVLIYFDVDLKRTILRNVARVLSPDGFLLLGGAETTLTLVDSFQRIEIAKSSFYQRAQSTGLTQP